MELYNNVMKNGSKKALSIDLESRKRVTRKRHTKRLRHTGNLFRKNLQLKDVC